MDLALAFDAQKLWWGMGSSNKSLVQTVLDEKCSSSLAAQTGLPQGSRLAPPLVPGAGGGKFLGYVGGTPREVTAISQDLHATLRFCDSRK